jgi:hypothetical protein
MERAHQNIEMLQTDVRKLIENQQKTDKMVADVQAEQADLKVKIQVIYDSVLSIVEHFNISI